MKYLLLIALSLFSIQLNAQFIVDCEDGYTFDLTDFDFITIDLGEYGPEHFYGKNEPDKTSIVILYYDGEDNFFRYTRHDFPRRSLHLLFDSDAAMTQFTINDEEFPAISFSLEPTYKMRTSDLICGNTPKFSTDTAFHWVFTLEEDAMAVMQYIRKACCPYEKE